MFNPFVLIHSRPAQYNYAIVYSGKLFRAVSRILNWGGGGRVENSYIHILAYEFLFKSNSNLSI